LYVVTKGCYSDYHIVGIFSTRESAQACTSSESDEFSSQIEEWELDTLAGAKLQTLYKVDINLKTGEPTQRNGVTYGRETIECICLNGTPIDSYNGTKFWVDNWGMIRDETKHWNEPGAYNDSKEWYNGRIIGVSIHGYDAALKNATEYRQQVLREHALGMEHPDDALRKPWIWPDGR
jgi:hypothetical protein